MTASSDQYRKRADSHAAYLDRCRVSKATHSHQLVDVAADVAFSDVCARNFDSEPDAMIEPVALDLARLGEGRIATDIDQSEYVKALGKRLKEFRKQAKRGEHFVP